MITPIIFIVIFLILFAVLASPAAIRIFDVVHKMKPPKLRAFSSQPFVPRKSSIASVTFCVIISGVLSSINGKAAKRISRALQASSVDIFLSLCTFSSSYCPSGVINVIKMLFGNVTYSS
jgi:hypothetical protein